MTHYLCITVNFLTGRYHGEEWPPSPARLFQALVAGSNAGCRAIEWHKQEPALRWLESLQPPEIVAPCVKSGQSYKHYAPNNDTDSLVKELLLGVPLKEASRQILTPKTVRPWLIEEGSSIQYLWRVEETELQYADVICSMARNIMALGWGIDIVTGVGALLREGDPQPQGRRYRPDSGNTPAPMLSVPTKGYLGDLARAYQSFRSRLTGPAVDTDTRPRLSVPVPYRIMSENRPRSFVGFELRNEAGTWRSFRWQDGMEVAAWLRHAAKVRMQIEGQTDEWIDSYICGHTEKGQENRRLSYVPLPSIGHEHVDGRIRRVIIALPREDSGEVLPWLKRMGGDELRALQNDKPTAVLSAANTDGVLNRYIAKSRVWLSVTPVVLHGRDHDGGRFSLRKAEKLILNAFSKDGYDIAEIEEFSYQEAPYWRGCGAARMARVPGHLSKWPRHHVRVIFRNPVEGPVLAGIGRHCGLGVFAASE